MRSRYTPLVRAEVNDVRALLLPGWQVQLVEEPPADEESPAAVIGWHDHLFTASLWLSDEVLSGEREYRKSTIVHEMMHPLFRGLRTAFMPEEGSEDEALWVHLEEQIVERVALAFGDPCFEGVVHEDGYGTDT